MIGKEKLFNRLEKTLARSRADETDVVFTGTESGLTRYANSEIHQNVFENNTKIIFRSVIGKKVGVASTNSLNTDDLKAALANSYEIAMNQPENPDFPGLPGPAKYREMDTYDEHTAKYSPLDRAKTVKKIIAAADDRGFTVAGALSSGRSEIAVLNSKGVRAYQPASHAAVNIISMSDTSSGYAAGLSRRVNDIDFDMLAGRAVSKCDIAQNPKDVEPGEYEVILEPPAVGELLEWLNYIGFGSKSFEDGTSFLAGKIGKKITSEMITISDDALDQKSIAFPFDFEGNPKKKVTFIDKGTAKGVVHNRMSAKKEGVRTTGHALPPDESAEGALGLNMSVVPGKAARSKMIEKVKKGILVTRFHYINGFIDTANAVLTGMTRDGTFLIENGEIVSGLKNLRFTDSMLRAFGTAVAISKETELIESWWSSVGCIKAPVLHLGSFRFSGKTSF